MKRFLLGGLLAALYFSLAACGKGDQSAADSPPAPTSAAPAPAAPTEAAPTGGPNPSAETNEKNEPVEEVTEQVSETEEGAETKDEPSKGTAPLKLTQLPPRAPAGSKFKEGVHYVRLSPAQPVEASPEQVEIIEFFWYGCPHCFAIDPRLESWRKGAQSDGKSSGGKPEFVAFRRVPGAWSDIARFHGRFYFALESLGKIDELHSLVFREIHDNGNQLNTIDKAKEFFNAHGVDAQAFQKNFGAMSVERKLDESNALARRYRISGVPTFVVNGKFMLDVPSAGGEAQLIELLNELATREHNKE